MEVVMGREGLKKGNTGKVGGPAKDIIQKKVRSEYGATKRKGDFLGGGRLLGQWARAPSAESCCYNKLGR